MGNRKWGVVKTDIQGKRDSSRKLERNIAVITCVFKHASDFLASLSKDFN